MKLYTKFGDKGNTQLYDGTTVSKTSQICDVIGEIDELNVRIGDLAINTNEIFLREIQYMLMNISSLIATPNKNKQSFLPQVTSEDITLIERQIDFYHKKVPPLKEFVIPCYNQANTKAHLCRTHTRTVERKYLELQDRNDNIAIYINRLSDFFFAYSRYLCNDNELKISQLRNEKKPFSIVSFFKKSISFLF